MSFRDEILKAKASSGISDYAIAKSIGIDPSVLTRFNAGDQGLTMDTLDALADLLNLHVVGGPIDPKKLAPRLAGKNPVGYRIRCIDNRVEGLISNFPRVGFKDWEAEERKRLSEESGKPVKLTHYRLDSPEGRKRLTKTQLREFGLL